MQTNDFNDELRNRVVDVEKIIRGYLPDNNDYQKTVIEAMNYSVLAGGKRLRPLLISETMKLFTKDEIDEANPFMAAIEMIHTYSLVHDDLPAMDNDDLRRGKPTTHKKFGHAMGILAGDGLLNYAYEIMLKAIITSNHPQKTARAAELIARKAGIYGMVGGQAVDVEMTGSKMSAGELNFVYDYKTCALIEASMSAGAILGNATNEECKKISDCAMFVGRAFQIQDDILDIISTTEMLGKPILSDEKNNKSTYCTLYGIDKAKSDVEFFMKEAISIIKTMNHQNDFLTDLLYKLIYRVK